MIVQAELKRKQSEYEGEACSVDKVIELPAQRFRQFSRALLADYDFIAENKTAIRHDTDSRHCLLILNANGTDGFLVDPQGYNYARYSAFVPNARSLLTSDMEIDHSYISPAEPWRDENRDEMLRMTLHVNGKPDYTLVLPADEEYLDAVKAYLDIDVFTDAMLRDIRFKVPYFGGLICDADCPAVEDYNDFAEKLEAIWQKDGMLLTYAAILDAERPKTLHRAVELLRNLDNYQRIVDTYGYTYQEISALDGYVVDNTKYPITITTETLNITETRTNALAKGSLTVNKVDADTGKALAGVTYRLFDSTGNKIADATTDTDGKAVFADLPLGSYTYQEISAPEGYVVDDTKYPITITTETLNITETRTNIMTKGSLTVRKVDVTGSPLAGAELLLETSVDGQTWTEVSRITSDKTGVAKWENLKIGAQYRVTETKAPAGYTLMAEPLFTGVLDNTNLDVTITACNSAGFVLPFTGSTGFTTYFLFAALMLCMGIYFCKKSDFMKETTK